MANALDGEPMGISFHFALAYIVIDHPTYLLSAFFGLHQRHCGIFRVGGQVQRVSDKF